MRSHTILTLLFCSTITAAKIAYEKYPWPGLDEDGNSKAEDLLGDCYETYVDIWVDKLKESRRVADKTNTTNTLCDQEDWRCGCTFKQQTKLEGQIWKDNCKSKNETEMWIYYETWFCASTGYLFSEEAFRQGNKYNATGKEVETSIEPFFPAEEWDTLDDPKWVPECYTPCKEKLDKQIQTSSSSGNSTFCETDDEPCHCTHEGQLKTLAECLTSTCPEERDVDTTLWIRTLQCADAGILINRSAFLAGMKAGGYAEKVDLRVLKAENETDEAESEAEEVEPESSAVNGAVGFGMFAVTTVGVLIALF